MSRKIKGLFLGLMIICLSLIATLGIVGFDIYSENGIMSSEYRHKEKKILEDDFYKSNYFENYTINPIVTWIYNSVINEEDSLQQEKFMLEGTYSTWDEEKQKDIEIVPTKEDAIKGLEEIKKDSIKELDKIKNAKFIVADNKDNIIYTNTKYKNIEEYENNIDDYVDIKITRNLNEGPEYIKNIDNKNSFDDVYRIYGLLNRIYNDDLEIRLSFPKIMKEGDYLYKDYSNYNKSVEIIKFIAKAIVVNIIVFIVSFIIYKLIKVSIFKEESKFIYILTKIPLEIWLSVLVLAGGCVFVVWDFYWLSYIEQDGLYEITGSFDIPILIGGFMSAVIFMTMMYLLLKTVKSYNKKLDILKNTLIYKIYKILKNSILKTFTATKNMVVKTSLLSRNIPLVRKVLMLSAIWIFVVTALMTFGFMTFLYALAVPIGIVMSAGGIIYLFIKEMSYLDEIIKGTEKIKSGEINHKIEVKGDDYLTTLAENINNIGEGLENSIDKQLRSERMKSELITNVSHDLKTPLTSIINYVELIKKEENIEPEHVKDYINVLDSKSKRLKVLIEDLFEASKASSGNIQLNMEKIEIRQLLRQAIGEMEEKLSENNLDIKLRVPEEKVYIKADGRRLYRVLENLLSNISKYSLENTRVYIDVMKNEDSVKLVMKNISSYELNFNPEEIMERFKRADESRNTEGSGLGLAIARDLVNIQGGEFEIDIDGDLFKSVVEFKTIE
ncbi:MAG: sensor histidine kinase [Peptostreptococcaceae bacterium]